MSSTQEKVEEKKFDFLVTITSLAVLVYLGGAFFGLSHNLLTWDKFQAYVGDVALMLLAYWAGGKR